MGSSNRHWPSMFKSKPQQHHMHHDIISSACRASPYSSSGCDQERSTPEPKPRWNPKPEQIRILEAIFNSGMVNPPRDEIKKIRAQLQEYGQVGDANVFYWFQNRKSRSKHKQRHQLQTTKTTSSLQHPPNPPPPPPPSVSSAAATPSFSSSSSDKSSASKGASSGHFKTQLKALGSTDLFSSPTASVNYTNISQSTHDDEFIQGPPFYFPCGGGGGGGFGVTQGLCFDELLIGNGASSTVLHHDDVHDQTTAGGSFSGLFLGEMIAGRGDTKRVDDEDIEKLQIQQELSFFMANPTSTNSISAPPPPSASPLPSFPGAGESGCGFLMGAAGRSTVFINDVAFKVPLGPFNVRDAFGDEALLVHSLSGHPVLTNEWGVTLQPLQNGAFYYLMRTLPLKTAVGSLFDKIDNPHFPSYGL
ncbi:hypothetical protein Dimus_032696 [Dionaea muscipula]